MTRDKSYAYRSMHGFFPSTGRGFSSAACMTTWKTAFEYRMRLTKVPQVYFFARE